MIGYHVTLRENLSSILNNGLIPSIGERSSQLTEDSLPLESIKRVYLFPTKDDCDTALGQWLGDEFEDVEEDGLVIIEVDLSGIKTESDCAFEVSVKEVINRDKIIKVFKEDW